MEKKLGWKKSGNEKNVIKKFKKKVGVKIKKKTHQKSWKKMVEKKSGKKKLGKKKFKKKWGWKVKQLSVISYQLPVTVTVTVQKKVRVKKSGVQKNGGKQKIEKVG